MKLHLACIPALVACAGAQTREPACAEPAARAEIQQVQIGWSRIDPADNRPPVVDASLPTRSQREAEALANDLLAQCRRGARMESLQDRYSEVPGGSILVGPAANVPFRAASLCLRKNECAMVRGNVAFHVIKRIG
jgi:hypothetical protein